jgi:hypothetical protein
MVIFENFYSQNLATLAKNFTKIYILLYEAYWIIFCHQVAKIHQKETLEIKGLIIKDHNWV